MVSADRSRAVLRSAYPPDATGRTERLASGVTDLGACEPRVPCRQGVAGRGPLIASSERLLPRLQRHLLGLQVQLSRQRSSSPGELTLRAPGERSDLGCLVVRAISKTMRTGLLVCVVVAGCSGAPTESRRKPSIHESEMCLVVRNTGNILHDLQTMKTPQATRAISSLATTGLPFGLAAWIPQSRDAAFERAFRALNHGDVRGFVSESGRECSALGL
jgi:hypothetical protein